MSKFLDDKVALVTGGSRGIGRAVAEALGEVGARVVLTARTAESAGRTAAELVERGLDVRGVALDVSRPDEVGTVAASLLQDYGRIAILVNNAGIARDSLLMRMNEEDWDSVLRTNLTGVYRLCRALVPSMVRARYGRIVNVTSVVGATGNPGQANYAASKAGIEGFSRSLARELASRNVTVNCIAPGFIDTDMTRELPEKARQELLARIPLGRLGSPEDVSAAALFLVGPGADYITGITLNVNGGMHM